jgi:hypothetical protein
MELVAREPVRALNPAAACKYPTEPWDDEPARRHIADAFRYYEEIVRPRSNSAGSPGGENNSSARSGGNG